MNRLAADRRGGPAMEFALCFPALLLFIFGFFAAYSLITTKRAMDYGVEKALRYAAVNSTATVAAIQAVYSGAAGLLWTGAGTITGVTVTYTTTIKTNDTVNINVTYAWTAPAVLKTPYANSIFTSVTLGAGGSMLMVN